MNRPVRIAADHVLTVPLSDIEIMRGGDGRTVTAYAAMFALPYEVRDQFGHYDEIINRAAFNRDLGRAGRAYHVLFNHGRDLYGNPSDRYSMPLGLPLEVKPDGRGLLTVTRYSKTDLADEVLELIRDGAITAQSFRGPIYKSSPGRQGPNGRPVIERFEMGLKDYGPAPFAINMGAEIVGVRAESVSDLAGQIVALSPAERADLVSVLAGISPDPHEDDLDDVDVPGGQSAPDPLAEAHVAQPGQSIDLLALAAENRRRRTQV